MNSTSILNSYQNQILNKIAPGKKTWERQRGLDHSYSTIKIEREWNKEKYKLVIKYRW